MRKTIPPLYSQAVPNQTNPRQLPRRPTRPRAERILNVVFGIVVGAVLLLVIALLASGSLRIVFEGPWIAAMGTTAFTVILTYRFFRLRLIRAFLAPNAGFVCPRCHFSLKGLPDIGACPECGTEYSRNAVVALWESAYAIKSLFPRSTAQAELDRDWAAHVAAIADPAPSFRKCPWATWTFPDSLAKVEALARRRGHRAARFPMFAHDLDEAARRLGGPEHRQLPADLFGFLAWFDPSLWGRFLHDDLPRSHPDPARAEESPLGQWAEAASASHAIDIRSPGRLQTYTLEEGARECKPLRVFIERRGATPQSAAWLQMRLIEFADVPSLRGGGAIVCYCIDPPPADLRPGAIVVFVPGAADRVWLADSLAQWLTRLAACDGIDAILFPALADRLPPDLRTFVEEDTRSRNPTLDADAHA
jgi:hypothetical protein